MCHDVILVLCRMMRSSMLSTACEVGVPDAVAWAKQQFASWIDHSVTSVSISTFVKLSALVIKPS